MTHTADDQSTPPSSDLWTAEDAATYDTDEAARFSPEAVDPVVDRLEELADGGPVLELAIGTGRIGLPLARRGVEVAGIELSEPMAAVLAAKPGGNHVPVAIGDMAAATAAGGEGHYAVVYLVFNTLSNLRTQAEQVACFTNAARHLRPGGRFVLELEVPRLRHMTTDSDLVPGTQTPEHLVVDRYDLVTQALTSRHYHHEPDGSVRYGEGHFRYVWPSESDLMAQLAGMELEHRWSGWRGEQFTATSATQVAVWRKVS